MFSTRPGSPIDRVVSDGNVVMKGLRAGNLASIAG